MHMWSVVEPIDIAVGPIILADKDACGPIGISDND